MSLTNVPPTIRDPQLRVFLSQVKDMLENPSYSGQGIVNALRQVGGSSGGGDTIIIGGGGDGTGDGGYDPMEDYRVPDAPTGFEAHGSYSGIQLSWDPKTPNQRNVAHTEVWRSETDNLEDATLTGLSVGSVYTDGVGVNAGYYYWIRYVSYTNVIGPWAAPWPAGAYAETAEGIEHILDALTGQIRESQIYSTLIERIDLIDGPPELEGSVADRLQSSANTITGYIDTRAAELAGDIQAEANLREWLLEQEAEDRNTAIASAISQMEDYADNNSAVALLMDQLLVTLGGSTVEALNFITTEIDSRLSVATTFSSISAEFDAVQGHLDNRATHEDVSQAIATADYAKVRDFNSLVAQFGGSIAGAEDHIVASVNDGLAITTTFNQLQAALGDANTRIDSRATYTEVDEAIATADYAAASDFTSLVAQFGGNIAGAKDYLVSEVDEELSVSTKFTEIDASFENVDDELLAKAAITYVDQSIASETSARNSQYSGLVSDMQGLENDLGEAIEAKASIEQINETIANAEGTEATTLAQLASKFGDNVAAIETQQSVINGLSAEYAVRLDVNGYVTGFGQYNDGTSSTFLIHSDYFAVGRPGEEPQYLFTIGQVNGEDKIVLDAKTFIGDAEITSAMVQTITADKIVVTGDGSSIADVLITEGTITNAMIEQIIQSDNFVEGQSGWKIDKTGAITASSIVIYGNSGNVIMSSGVGVPWDAVSGSNRPDNNANRTTSTSQLYDGAGLGSTADWGGVSGTGKPEDNANRTTDTNQLNDGAGLGSTADWSGVSGSGKPEDGADVTANHPQSAWWLTNSVVGDHQPISAANISTFMEAAAIKYAYIGHGEVGTLTLAGQSVTIAETYNSASHTSFNGGPSWQMRFSKSISMANATSDSAVDIAIGIIYGVEGYIPRPGDPEDFGQTLIRLRRGNTVLCTWNPDAVETEGPGGWINLSWSDKPGAGTHTYHVEMFNDLSAAEVSIFQRYLRLLGGKR